MDAAVGMRMREQCWRMCQRSSDARGQHERQSAEPEVNYVRCALLVGVDWPSTPNSFSRKLCRIRALNMVY